MAVRAGTTGLGVVLGDTILCVFAVDPGGPDDHRSYGRKRRVTTPRRGLLFHFTHMSNLAAIVRDGLRCDSEVTDTERVFTEVGNQVIKSRRRVRCVPVPPGGVVADYVPFYFAARSPMLYAVHMGNVAEYKGGQDDLVYLVSSIAAVAEHCLAAVFCDRNAGAGGRALRHGPGGRRPLRRLGADGSPVVAQHATGARPDGETHGRVARASPCAVVRDYRCSGQNRGTKPSGIRRARYRWSHNHREKPT